MRWLCSRVSCTLLIEDRDTIWSESYPDWVSESQRDSQRQSFWNSDYQDRDADDEELDEAFDELHLPRFLLDDKHCDWEVKNQDDDRQQSYCGTCNHRRSRLSIHSLTYWLALYTYTVAQNVSDNTAFCLLYYAILFYYSFLFIQGRTCSSTMTSNMTDLRELWIFTDRPTYQQYAAY